MDIAYREKFAVGHPTSFAGDRIGKAFAFQSFFAAPASLFSIPGRISGNFAPYRAAGQNRRPHFRWRSIERIDGTIRGNS
jgi:hypothetical protein